MSSFVAGVPLDQSLSKARVIRVNPDNFTATVNIIEGTKSGTISECAIRSLGQNVETKTGIFILPEIGDEVYVSWAHGGTPIITDYVPFLNNAEEKQDYRTKLTPVRTFGGEDPIHQNSGKKRYRNGPIDLMPGDKVIMGKLRNFVGVLSGGLTVLRGGELSQIFLCKIRQLVKVVAKNFELFTDFGQIRIVNEGGGTSLEMLGNDRSVKSNQHLGSEWDYVFRMGGENLLELSLHKDKFQFYVNRDGHATVNTAKSFTVNLSTPPSVNILGNVQNKIDGHKEDYIARDAQKTIGGLYKESCSRKTQIVEGAYNSVIGGPASKTYRGHKREVVSGTSLLDLTSTVGKECRVAAGDYSIEIGNPKDLGVPSPLLAAQAKTGDYNLKTFAGDIVLSAFVKGNVDLNTKLGDVKLSTIAGNLNFSTKAGNLALATLGGNVDISTKMGNLSFTTVSGNLDIGTTAGNVQVYATVGGKITLSAGTASIEIGPAGIKITNNGMELLQLVQDIIQTLSTTKTPGYMSVIDTAPMFGQMIPKIITLKGA